MNYRVDSATEALSMLETLRSSGEYDLFRGQHRNWQVCSSFSRLDEFEKSAATHRMQRFRSWAQRTDGMQGFAEDEDALFAVAQHYGIATPFVDFSTSPAVALQFALHAKQCDDDCCVVLLNSNDFNEFLGNFEDLIPALARVKIIRPKTPNLWRLEAQSGVFLDLPVFDFEHQYDFDRLFFPAHETSNLENLPEIYPQRKSDLERLLDQYFMEERLQTGNAFVLENSGHKIQFMTLSEDHVRDGVNTLIVREDVQAHKSWRTENTDGWHQTHLGPEKYQPVEKSAFELRLTDPQDLRETSSVASSSIFSALQSGELDRRDLRAFTVTLPENHVCRKSPAALGEGVSRIWDGMRRLPYADSDIARAITRYLEISSVNGEMERLYRQPIQIDFGGQATGSYSRAWVDGAFQNRLTRSDIEDCFIVVDHKAKTLNLPNLLMVIRSPEKLFEFFAFSRFFAEQVIPSQEFERGASSLAQFYSPVDVKTFGLA